MSLDVYLKSRGRPIQRHGTGVFVRENGARRELTAEEVAAQFPGAEVSEQEYESDETYSANITHNLSEMADAAGIYYALWRPEEIGITKAGQLISLLEAGLVRLLAEPERFKKLNPSNGWGDYDGLVDFVRGYLGACRYHPEATVEASR